MIFQIKIEYDRYYKTKTYFEKAFNYDMTFPQYQSSIKSSWTHSLIILTKYKKSNCLNFLSKRRLAHSVSLIVLVIQICRSDDITEKNYLMTRYWHDVKSLCSVSTLFHNARERKVNLSTLISVYARKYLITTMSSLFSNAVFMSSWHMKFHFILFFQHQTRYKQNILKCYWISDSQICIGIFELISISSFESDPIFFLFHSL